MLSIRDIKKALTVHMVHVHVCEPPCFNPRLGVLLGGVPPRRHLSLGLVLGLGLGLEHFKGLGTWVLMVLWY